ncbi:CARDB domain-containing protein [Thermococcus sp. 5-4]|uniref:CARDB domain-containing protein n=1 Tax=Thermococcus sp. 5-4 TaxID=2008440 RepID=UPI0014398177|nr:CARDB domain-containing protein [Thermococcus sp. 5-4]
MNAANVTVYNTTFWNVSDYSIYSLNSSEVYINNTVQEPGPNPPNFLFVNNGKSITLENTRAGAYNTIVNVTNTDGLRIVDTYAGDSRRMLVATNSSNIEVTGVTSNEISITVVEIRNSSKVTLRGDVFTRSYADNGPGINITNTDDVLIDNVTIDNYDLLIRISNSSNVTVRNSNFPQGEQSEGIGVQVANSTGIAINSNSYQKDQPIRIFNSSNIEITRNTMPETRIGIHIELSQNISVRDNFIAEFFGGETGVNITDSRVIAIENNRILNFSAGIFAANITDTSIADNTIAFSNATAGNIDFSTGGILIEGLPLLEGGGPSGNNNTPNATTVQGLLDWIFSSISTLQIRNVNVTGNVVYGENYDPGATGILVVATPRTVLIANNTVTNFGMGIVGLIANGTKVVDNTVSDIKSNISWGSEFFVPGAIAFGVSANASVEGNHIRNSTIFMANAFSAQMNMSKNRALDGEYGLIVVFSNLTSISSNYISNTTFALMAGNLFSGVVYNNFFNSSNGTRLFNSSIAWNVSKTRGFNIVGGPYLGGNFWANSTGTGFSQNCTDADQDGICDVPYQIDGNNTDYLPLAVPPNLPDLTVSNLSAVLVDPTRNVYNVTITVENVGTRDAGPFNVTLLENGTEIWDTTVTGLATGESITLNFTWTPAQGVYNLTAMADPGYPNDSVIESNESNNERHVTVTVGPELRADLIVTNISTPGTIYAGDTVQINATVANDGTYSAGPFNVTLTANGTVIDTVLVSGLGAGSDIGVTFSWTPSTPGTYNLTVIADSSDSVLELDESDNALSTEVRVIERLPDLLITGMAAPALPQNGSPVTVNVTVFNNGTLDSPSFNVSLYVNSSLVGTQSVAGLNVGDYVTLHFNWTPALPGLYNLTAVADPENSVREYVETNNEHSIWVQVVKAPIYKPDLTVTRIYLPPELVRGELAVINATVLNRGNVSATSVNVTLYADGVPVSSQVIPLLPVGSPTNVSLSWTPSKAGSAVLEVVADPDNVIPEFNETNNGFAVSVNVAERLPDLVVLNVSVPSIMQAGDNVTVNVTVLNSGNASASDVNVTLYADSDILGSALISALNPGANVTLSFNWTPEYAGIYNLTAVVDPDNSIEEFNESNNNLSVEAFVEPAPSKPPGRYGEETYGVLFDMWNLWTRWFFMNYEELSELYPTAVRQGVNEDVLASVRDLNSTGVGFIREAWRGSSLEEIRGEMWGYVTQPVLWYKARKAYLAEKEAVELLKQALGESGG